MSAKKSKKVVCTCHPHSAFFWWREDYPQQIDWSRNTLIAKLSENSSKAINDQRLLGRDVATIPGLGRTTIHIDPRRFHVYTKAIAGKM